MRITNESMEAIILAGGKGTRLRSLVKDVPKPMAEVAGRPFLEWLLLTLKTQGLQRAVLCTGYRAEVIESYFKDGASLEMELRYSRECNPLGTGGAVRHALDMVQAERLLVLNGDSFCRIDLSRLRKTHLDCLALATLWVVHREDCSRYGQVFLSDDGTVIRFTEKSPTVEPGLINAGVYLLERKLVESIPDRREASLEKEVFPSLIGNGLVGVIGNGPFLDIGTPEDYMRASAFITAEVTA
jgi:NDP-sugar pyrophosphorylase family protein